MVSNLQGKELLCKTMEQKWRDIESLDDLYEIYTYLPKLNCKRCGETTCLGFASKVASGARKMKHCLVISEKF